MNLVIDDPTHPNLCERCGIRLCTLCSAHLDTDEPGPECRPCAEGPYWVEPGPREVWVPYGMEAE